MKAIATALLLAALTTCVLAQKFGPDDIRVGSSAEIWLQRSPQVKVGFLEGLCEGFAAAPAVNLDLLYCARSLPKDLNDKGWHKRFCGQVSADSRKAVEYMDNFFMQKKYSDVPNWAAIAAYNDKACGEQVASAVSLARMQKKGECFRALSNMPMSVAREARDAQRNHCATLPDR